MKQTRFFKLISVLLVLFLIGTMLVSCGGEAGASPDAEIESPAAGLDASAAGQQGKIVITMTVNAYSDNFKEDLATLKNALYAVGGYIATSNSSYTESSGNRFTATLKVPADKCQAFSDSFSEYLEIRSSSVESEDITEQYIDAESRIKALETERDSLQKMMSEESNYNDVFAISKRLTEVISDLEKAKALLAEYEKRTAYSTIHLTLTEILPEEVEEEEGFFSRLGNTFVDSFFGVVEFFGDLIVFFIGEFPTLFTIGLVPFGIILWVKISKKRKAKRRASQPQTPPTQTPPPAYRPPYQPYAPYPPSARPPMPPQTPPVQTPPTQTPPTAAPTDQKPE